MIGIHNKIWYKQRNIFADFENLLATDYGKFSAVQGCINSFSVGKINSFFE